MLRILCDTYSGLSQRVLSPVVQVVQIEVCVSMGCRLESEAALCSLHISPDNMQRNIWDEVEQENADLVQRHPRVVQSIKLLTRQLKPSAVQPMHPIVREHEE